MHITCSRVEGMDGQPLHRSNFGFVIPTSFVAPSPLSIRTRKGLQPSITSPWSSRVKDSRICLVIRTVTRGTENLMYLLLALRFIIETFLL